MFVRYNYDEQGKPIKIWLQNIEDLEEGALQQAINVSNLPFIHKHIALMPDTHQGYGVPIGCVLATKGVVIPNAVGVDIGCGMAFVETNIHKSELTREQLEHLVGQIMRNVPTGFNKHKERQDSVVLDTEFARVEKLPIHLRPLTEIEELVVRELKNGYYQVGTLGGGNHFIEIQEDENGYLCIMLHSGSRHLGYAIANHFNKLAESLNETWHSKVPSSYELAFLPTNTEEGQQYIHYMNLALDFAMENRQKMLDVVKRELVKVYGGEIEFANEVNAHHNYASLENHFGQNVWVHRKGAIQVREGQLGIIPSAMGGYSYVVRGKGNAESFHSASHGAGRKMSRKKASEQFTSQETIEDLNSKGVILGKTNKSDVADESIWAYKSIDDVLANEEDLVEVVKELKTVCVIKG